MFTLMEAPLMSPLSTSVPAQWFRLFAFAAMFGALGSARAGAQSVLYGCYVPSSGTVYRIKGAGLPDECRSQQHVQFTWSLQGPAGAQGPAGPQGATGPQGPAGGLSGYQVVESRINALPGPATGHTAECPTGKRVVGGGFATESTSDAVVWTIIWSRPATDPFNPTVWSRWAVQARHNSATQQFFTVYAVCAATT